MPPGLIRPIGITRLDVVAGVPLVFGKLAAGGECCAVAVPVFVGWIIVLTVEGGTQFAAAALLLAVEPAFFVTTRALWLWPSLQPPSIGKSTIMAASNIRRTSTSPNLRSVNFAVLSMQALISTAEGHNTL